MLLSVLFCDKYYTKVYKRIYVWKYFQENFLLQVSCVFFFTARACGFLACAVSLAFKAVTAKDAFIPRNYTVIRVSEKEEKALVECSGCLPNMSGRI